VKLHLTALALKSAPALLAKNPPFASWSPL